MPTRHSDSRFALPLCQPEFRLRSFLRSLLVALSSFCVLLTFVHAEIVGGTPALKLNGRWDFRFDAADVGEAAGWYKPTVDGAWQSIQVPGSYNDQFEGKHDYAGKAWYRTHFSVSPAKGEHTVLRLGGVVLRAKVWVNGKLAGTNILPYAATEFDISGLVGSVGSENVLVVETDNAVLTKSVLDSNWKGWQNDGGLIWPVEVKMLPALYSATHLTTTMDPDGGWDAAFNVVVHNHSAAQVVNLSAAIMDGEQTVWSKTDKFDLTGEETPLHLTAAVQGIQAWSPDSPHLYRYVLRVGAADKPREEIAFGFRQIEVHGSKLTLNAKPLLLRGMNRQSFYPGVGMSVPAAQTATDFQDIKALHANFVRLSHYPQPEEAYELCDRLGLLVWTEIPVWQTTFPNLTDPAIWSDYIQPLLKASVTQHWNHPSVVVWSVGNEVPSEKPQVAAVIKKEIDYVKSLDASRLVTFASDRREKDISFGPVDFISINEYFGWYYGKETDLGGILDKLHAKYPDKGIFISEYGVESVAGWVKPKTASPDAKDYSLEHQAAFLQTHLEQIYAPSRRSFMLGAAPWLYNDFPTPYSSNTADHPDSIAFINAKGLVTQQREHKPAYDTVQKFYEQLEREAQSR
jgi:beta-glucuronidase